MKTSHPVTQVNTGDRAISVGHSLTDSVAVAYHRAQTHMIDKATEITGNI